VLVHSNLDRYLASCKTNYLGGLDLVTVHSYIAIMGYLFIPVVVLLTGFSMLITYQHDNLIGRLEEFVLNGDSHEI
jgi:hypothetical protein